ncbi:2Fe-2S iron-sulfur cluster-binding protein [Rhodobacter sp.]
MTRLPAPFGSRIDRSRPLAFSFDGRQQSGFAGDCIASALAAEGRWILSRSFKYHRPRGIMSMAGAEANTLVQLPGDPNVLADMTPLAAGMQVMAQNVSGSAERDRLAVMDRLGRFMPVGFYYRSFMGPTRSSWLKLWEPMIRRAAGLGRIDGAAPQRSFHKAHLHCDLLVVGAGPAGLSAAITAARAGADVILCDENPEIGGSLTWCGEASDLLERLLAEARGLPGLRLMTGTVCNGWFADNWLPLIQGDTLWRTRAREVVLATGTLEQPAIFRNNDLPGILFGGAVQRLIRHYAVRPGRRAVVLAACPAGYRAARDLLDAGVELAMIVDPRPGGSDAGLAPALRDRGVTIRHGSIDEARGNRGNRHLAAVRIAKDWIDCDLLSVSAGRMPAWQLPCQAGGRLTHDAATESFHLDMAGAQAAPLLAGSVAGAAALDAVTAHGRQIAAAALKRLGLAPVADTPDHPAADAEAALANHPVQVIADPSGRNFVDFDEDLQVKDIRNAIAEGYRELELVKRFSTLGMGPSQGRHSAAAAARIVAEATARPIAEVGVTTARPPVGPERLGALAGPLGHAERRTALHGRHLAAGARMFPAGAWWRPAYYGPQDEAARLIREEVIAVREGAGMLDVSTLGKLEIRGPDAGAFLDRLYTMAHGTQAVGRVRYCLMLNEMGTVIDDGVAFRMAPDRFYVTATTGAVARVYADMLFWNSQWRMQVDVLNMTGAFAALNLTGPAIRPILAALPGDIDFARDAFGYMDGRTGSLAGVPVRAMRIGFTGELSYELHCPASLAPALWDALIAAGAGSGLRPYGLEASRILRLEKGHIIIGQDTDALTSPAELGFGWAISRKKPFFIGKRSIEMRARLGETRRLVGLDLRNQPEVPEESCLVLRDGMPVGHVTSSAFSPTLGRQIALAYVHAEDAAAGSMVRVKCRSGRVIEVPVASHAFFDPDNARQDI